MSNKTYESLHSVDDRSGFGEVTTPQDLVTDMLSKIPEHVFKSSTTTFLDPCFGNGTFLVEIIKRLRNHGHSMENIQERIYGYELSLRLFNKTAKLLSHYNFSKLYNNDFLNTSTDMKFDVIVGNPPYQNGHNAKRWTLWSEFVKKGIESTDNELLFVIPNSWLGPGAEHNAIFEYLKFADLDVGHHFSVGSTFSYIQLDKYFTGEPTIKSLGKLYTVSRDDKFLPTNQEFIPINNKFFQGDTFNFTRTTEHHTSKKSEWMTEGEGYKVFHTNAQTLVSNKPPKRYNHESYKAYVTLSGYPEFKIDNNISFSQAVAWCNIEDSDVEYASSILTSKLYRVLVEQNKWSGWNSLDVIKSLPKPPLNKVYAESDLYEYFKFTEKEIELIENKS